MDTKTTESSIGYIDFITVGEMIGGGKIERAGISLEYCVSGESLRDEGIGVSISAPVVSGHDCDEHMTISIINKRTLATRVARDDGMWCLDSVITLDSDYRSAHNVLSNAVKKLQEVHDSKPEPEIRIVH